MNTKMNKEIIKSSTIFEVAHYGSNVVTIVKPSHLLTDSEYNGLKPLISLVGGFWREKYGGFSFNARKSDVERKMNHCISIDSFNISDEALQRSKHKFYPTPSKTAKALVDLANITELDTCLEPSAGQGGLLRYIVKKTSQYVAVELDSLNAEKLVRSGYKVYNMSFEDYYRNNVGRVEFTRVVMNPPFAQTLCLRHVMMAYDLLAKGGVLVSILPENSLYYRDNEVTSQFNRLCSSIKSDCQFMQNREFANMGVVVDTVIVTLYK